MSNSLTQKIVVFVIAFPLYFALFFLPILGPALVGVYVGRKLLNIRDSMITSLSASVTSFVLLSFLIFPSAYDNILLALILLTWQFLSLLAVVVGTAAGSLYKELDSLNKVFKYTKKKATGERRRTQKQSQKQKKEPFETEGPVYVTCPSCGQANAESNVKCKSCGERL